MLLPDGYDDGARRSRSCSCCTASATPTTLGQARQRRRREHAKGLPAIVVMPEGGKGFYTNWFNGGTPQRPGLGALLPRRADPAGGAALPGRPGRRNHAIAGLSMGGFGTAYLAGQRPDYFGSASVVLRLRPAPAPGGRGRLRAVGGVEYTDIFGPMDGAYATGHNPTRIPRNLAATRRLRRGRRRHGGAGRRELADRGGRAAASSSSACASRTTSSSRRCAAPGST